MLGSVEDDVKSKLVQIKVLAKSVDEILSSGSFYTEDIKEKTESITRLVSEIEKVTFKN